MLNVVRLLSFFGRLLISFGAVRFKTALCRAWSDSDTNLLDLDSEDYGMCWVVSDSDSTLGFQVWVGFQTLIQALQCTVRELCLCQTE